MERYLVLNGPNLNLLGTRDPSVYGSTTLADLQDACRKWGGEIGARIETTQSNHEGVLIDALHDARHAFDGVVLNPGAYTHTSYAIHDAIAAIGIPVVEVHISNVEEREPWRRTSVVRPACVATIYGRGVEGYRWAIRHLFHRREWPARTVRYAENDDAVMDVRRPSGPGPHPTVVLVHGGFWRHMWTRDTMDGVAVDLAREGFLTANVEYRRVGAGGGWPVTAEDVAAAIETVAGLDGAGPMAVVGHSAGGQLAVCARTMTGVRFLPVSLAGVLDLEQAAADGVGGSAVPDLVGDGDPGDASPVRVVAQGEVVAVHGTADDVVPASQSRSYCAANADARLVELDGVGHFEFLERSEPAWRRVRALLMSALGASPGSPVSR